VPLAVEIDEEVEALKLLLVVAAVFEILGRKPQAEYETIVTE
jgi:hypothetical protein